MLIYTNVLLCIYMQIHVAVDEETNKNLDILKERLNSPKAWIVKRLVAEEMKKQKMEAIAK